MLRQEALQGDWQMAIGLSASYVARRAQAADLVILGQRIPDHSTGLEAPEDVIPRLQQAGARRALCRPMLRPDRRECAGRLERRPRSRAGGAGRAAVLRMSGAVTVLLVDPRKMLT